jgi:hypothetical protein
LDAALSRRDVIVGAAAVSALAPAAPALARQGLIRQDITLDVTAACPESVSGGQPQWVGARVVAPATIDPKAETPVVICFHGGGYDKRYYDMRIPGRTGYSMAEHFARRGAVVVAVDYLGISGSSRPPSPLNMNRQLFGAVQHAASALAFERARTGTLAAGLPPLRSIRRVGMAHSQGVMLTITQQVEHDSFDQVALVGYSVRGVRLTRLTGPMKQREDPPGYSVVDRKALRVEYYMPDVPADVIAADEAAGAPSPKMLGKEATAGKPSSDAHLLKVPLFVALAERDIAPEPHQELAAFTGCDDLTFLIVAGAAHSLNVATTRQVLWDHVLAWIPAAPIAAAHA